MTDVRDWRLAELLAGTASVPAGGDTIISGLALDSRRVNPGDLFLAVAGASSHGLNYLSEALGRGAVAVAWEPVDGISGPPPSGRIPCVAIPDLRARSGYIADRFYNHPSRSMNVVGVTGTDGKTSVSQFVAQLLDEDEARCGVIGTLGHGPYGEAATASAYTTPDALTLHATLAAMRDRGVRRVVMEVSSHALDQGRINGVAFDVAVLTNLSRDHLDYHGSLEAYAAAKRSLFETPGLTHAVLNLDDRFGHEILAALGTEIHVLGYGLGSAETYPSETIVATQIAGRPDGTRFHVETPWGGGDVEMQLLGRFNVMNTLAALGTVLALGADLYDALDRLSHLRPVPGRMERFGGGNQPTLVVDFAHTPNALEHVLHALRAHCKGSLWCVFGAGGDRDRGKRPLMAEAVAQYADRIVVTSDNPRREDPLAIIEDIMGGFDGRRRLVQVEPDRAAAIRKAWTEAGTGDVILVAGKGHESVQIVGDEERPWSDREFARSLAGAEA